MSPRGYIPEENRKKLFIICGSYNEFRYWQNRVHRKTKDYTCIYAREDRIRGYRDGCFIRLGNWFTLRDHSAQIMLEIMSHHNFTELHYSDFFGFESEEAERDFYTKDFREEFLSEEEMWI